MNTIKLNIGLNVGTTEPKNQLKDTFFAVINSELNVTDNKVDAGKYIEMNERTFICEALTKLDLPEFTAFITFLCDTLNQECIAYKYNGIGYLTYASNFEGDKYEFNQDYFIE
jgi:hypothetical protein